MKALTFSKYGSPEVLHFTEVEKPIPKENEVLVKVKAVSLNASDIEFLTATPVYIRTFGLFKPKFKILGSDITGIVESVGNNVKLFKNGDEVLGDTLIYGFGGFAEYVCMPEHLIIKRPESINYDQAAAIPQAAVVALQGIRDYGKVQSGHKVLINGAGGGCGSFAIQLAKMYGAEVTGVDNNKKIETMRSMGANHVIDYKQQDFNKNGEQYDFILDFVAHRSILKLKKSLRPNGSYALVGGSISSILQSTFGGPLVSLFGKKRIGMLIFKQNVKDLQHVSDLIQAGKLNVFIDKVFKITETIDALKYLSDGHAKGKVIIQLS